MQDIKQEVRDYLDTVADGNFTTSGILPSAANAGLFLKGLGSVGLPVSERDGRAITSLRRGPPFAETIEISDYSHGPTMRELGPEQFELRNAQWSKTLQDVVGKTADQLGVIGGESSIRADLRKLCLYEKGCFLKSDHDTEAAKDVFATLIIVLPSAYEGGEVVVQIGNRKQRLSAPCLREFDYSYMAWYADVDYFFEPVTSGYFVALTFDLIHHSGELEKSRESSVLTDHRAIIDNALKAWTMETQNCSDDSNMLVYMLDHEYDEANFALMTMKDEDQARCHHLYDACQQHGFCVFLAHFEHSTNESRNTEYDDYCDDYSVSGDDDRPDWMLKKLFTL